MIELLMMAHIHAVAQMEADERWHYRFLAASAEEKKWMLAKREEEKKEREIERRHQEQIRAQEKIAEAIRFAAIMNS